MNRKGRMHLISSSGYPVPVISGEIAMVGTPAALLKRFTDSQCLPLPSAGPSPGIP